MEKRVERILEDRVEYLKSDTGVSRKKCVSGAPRWSASAWLSSLSLILPLSEALLSRSDTDHSDEVESIRSLCDHDIDAAVDEATAKIKTKLKAAVRQLQEAGDVDAQALSEKFAADSSCFTFKYGKMEDYHGGLEGLIGLPETDMGQQMQWEHKQSIYARETFPCFYGDTNATAEWDYATKAAKETKTKIGVRNKGRSGWTIDDFMIKNEKLIREAKLQKWEVIGLRLYTGPMFVWYNNILRGAKQTDSSKFKKLDANLYKEYLFDEYKDEPGTDVPFCTTLHVINSAILKLSRTQPAEKVYRGIKGGILPAEFWEPNSHNVRGGIEMAFMSTTRSREMAFKYATQGSQPIKMIFEIQMGMIDRGAPVQWISQFPEEAEILFAPLTGLEMVGTPTVERRAIVVQLRLNCNLHDRTIEEVIGQRKSLQIQTFRQLNRELAAKSLINRGFEDFVKKMQAEKAESFNQSAFVLAKLAQALDLHGQIMAEAVHETFVDDKTKFAIRELGDDKTITERLERYIGSVRVPVASASNNTGDWLAAMYKEHCAYEEDLVQSFGGIDYKSTALGEWQCVCGEWTPERRSFDFSPDFVDPTACDASSGRGFRNRELKTIDELAQHKMYARAKLKVEELVAIRLETSLMYRVYASNLRQMDDERRHCVRPQQGPKLHTGNAAEDARDCHAGPFPVTIHVACFALRKLSAATKPTPLYRGLANKYFPKRIMEAGFKYMEMGRFAMSPDKKVSIDYISRDIEDRRRQSPPEQGMQWPALLYEVEGSDSESWGADISWASFAPEEKEYSLPPMSTFVVKGAYVHELNVGTTKVKVVVLKVTATANKSALSLHQLVFRQRIYDAIGAHQGSAERHTLIPLLEEAASSMDMDKSKDSFYL